ncbi:MAG: tail fiber domain-containing protein [Ferruginibacter sp.]
MKQILLLFFVSVAMLYGTAQNNVGIGTTTPDASSIVEINSNNSGLLIPRLTAVQRMAISNAANGLLVFDTDSAAFAYRTGGTWLFLKGTISKANGWSTAGNSGTNSLSFIGTTDAQPLRFKTNSANAGWVDSTTSNTSLGFRSLDAITLGTANTAFGFKSMSSNNEGYWNAANGFEALYSNRDGSQNTANGAFALYNNTAAVANTANGANALYSNTTGSANTASGAYALTSNTTASNNTANGYEALELNTTGSENTANGAFTLVNNITGSANTANGNFSLYKNTTGSSNTASGDSSLANNSNGTFNTAFGASALEAIIVGDGNTAVGYNALGASNVTSQHNTAIGYNAGANASNGSNNVFVGYGAGILGSGLVNVVAIGQGNLVPTSNTVRLGNTSTINYQAFAGWTNISDGRFKNNVKEDVPGLAFINKLRPVTYNLAATVLDNFFHRNHKDSTDKKTEELETKALKEKEKITYTGFIAQDVEAAAKELGFNFSGVDKPKNDNDTYGLRYAEFVVPLVKAVQEQQKMIEDLKNNNADLQKQIDKLKTLIKK